MNGALAVSLGAALGACLRWQLGVWLNPLVLGVPLGTLAANLLGGYLVGVAVAVFHLHAGLAPALKLFAITGFLGGLTTFSTFSHEVMDAMSRGAIWTGCGIAALHLLGSLFCTGLGLWTVSLFSPAPQNAG